MDAQPLIRLKLIMDDLNVTSKDYILYLEDFKDKIKAIFRRVVLLSDLSQKDFNVENEINTIEKRLQELKNELRMIEEVSRDSSICLSMGD